MMEEADEHVDGEPQVVAFSVTPGDGCVRTCVVLSDVRRCRDGRRSDEVAVGLAEHDRAVAEGFHREPALVQETVRERPTRRASMKSHARTGIQV
jgi:hypothetical protein